MSYLKRTEYKHIFRFLGELLGYIHYTSLPKHMLERSLVKQMAMIIAYNGGVPSQTRSICDYLEEEFINLGVSKYPIDLEITSSFIVSSSFTIIEGLLKDAFTFKSTLNTYVEEFFNENEDSNKEVKKCVPIDMPYCKYEAGVYKTVTDAQFHRVRTPGHCYEFQIYLKQDIIDKRATKSTFPSIFVHGIDAFTCHAFADYLNHINTSLENDSKPALRYSSNNDCYIVCMPYAPYLKYFVRIPYNKVSTIPIVKEIFPDNKSLKCTNPFFIKH